MSAGSKGAALARVLEGLDLLDAGVVITDDGGEILATNRGVEVFLGWEEGSLVGREVASLVPDVVVPEMQRLLPDVLRNGGGRTAQVPLLDPRGETHLMDVLISVREVGEEVLLLFTFLRPTGDTASMMSAVQQVTMLLSQSSATTLTEVGTEVLALLGEHLRWDAGWVYEEFSPPVASAHWGEGEGSASLALRARSSAVPVFSEDGYVECATPVLVEGEVVGVLSLRGEGKRAFTGMEATFATVARQVGVFLQAARARQREEEQLALLSSISSALASSLDLDTSLALLAARCVGSISDVCAVFLRSEEGERSIVRAASTELAASILESWRKEEGGTLSRHVMEEGEGLILNLSEGRSIGMSDERLEALTSLGLCSSMGVPLSVHGRVVGALSFISLSRQYTERDLTLAGEVARRASLTVENVLLHTRLTKVARRLQATLLPPALPDIPGLEIASRYVAAGEVEAGGDFYDVRPRGDGAWVVVLGDVLGKGVDAALVTGLMRHTLGRAVRPGAAPGEILAEMDAALVEDDEKLCSALCLVVEEDEEVLHVSMVSGGHPLPLLRRGEGEVEEVGQPGGILGAFPGMARPEHSFDLLAGDTLVLYTDGVIERHRGEEFFGTANLVEVLRSGYGSAKDLAWKVVNAVRAFPGSGFEDDMAVLCLRAWPREARRRYSVDLPQDLASVGAARRELRRCLEEWGVEEDIPLLLASEVVTNAIVHASSPVHMEIEHCKVAVRIEVDDNSSAVPAMRTASEDETGGRGLGLVDALASAWGVEVRPEGKRIWFEVPV